MESRRLRCGGGGVNRLIGRETSLPDFAMSEPRKVEGYQTFSASKKIGGGEVYGKERNGKRRGRKPASAAIEPIYPRVVLGEISEREPPPPSLARVCVPAWSAVRRASLLCEQFLRLTVGYARGLAVIRNSPIGRTGSPKRLSPDFRSCVICLANHRGTWHFGIPPSDVCCTVSAQSVIAGPVWWRHVDHLRRRIVGQVDYVAGIDVDVHERSRAPRPACARRWRADGFRRPLHVFGLRLRRAAGAGSPLLGLRCRVSDGFAGPALDQTLLRT